MPKIGSALMLVLLTMGTVCHASDFGIAGFIGFGKGMFNDDDLDDEMYITDWEQPSYIPAGLQLTYLVIPQLQLGAEVELCLGAFKNDGETLIQGYTFDSEYETRMTELGAFGRFLFAAGTVTPFVRAGFGLYSGKMDEEADDVGYENDYDLNSALGFNFGGGLFYNVSPVISIGMEGVYHLSKLEAVDDNDWPEEKIGLNHLNVRAVLGASF